MNAARPTFSLRMRRFTGPATVHVGQRVVELIDQVTEARDGLLGLAQLVGEDLADAVHRLRRGVAVFPATQEHLDLGQAEAHVLQLLYPLDASHGASRIEPKSA